MPEANASAEGWIYFVEAEGLDLVKIGCTNNLAKRMIALQCGSPVKLRLSFAVWTARTEEKRLHCLCAPHRLHNEWFKTELCLPLLAAEIVCFESEGLRCVDEIPHDDLTTKKEYDNRVQQAWRARDPDKHRAYRKKWEANPENREKRAAWSRANRSRYPEATRAAQQRYVSKPEVKRRLAEQTRERKKRDYPAYLEKRRQWTEKNREKINAQANARYYAKKAAQQ